MDRDLNLSGAFGGLRITNPDSASDASPGDSEQQEPQASSRAQASSVPSASSTFQVGDGSSENRTGSLLGFDPASYSTEAYTTVKLTKLPSQVLSDSESPLDQPLPTRSTYSPSYPVPVAPKPASEVTPYTQYTESPFYPNTSAPKPAPEVVSYQQSSNVQNSRSPMISRQLSRTGSQRHAKRVSATPGYTPNPAATSAAQAAMTQRQYSGTRPTSTAYAPNHGLPARDEGYRLHKEPSQHSLAAQGPRRIKSTSRTVAEVAQAGVMIDETHHQERNYGSRPPVFGGNVVPPKRQGSRGMLRQRDGMNSGPGGYPAGSPYGLENGPAPSSEEWQEKGAAVRVTQTTDAEGRPVTRYTKKGVKDFTFGQLLGEGSYSQVHLARDRSTLTEYAIKVLDKRHIIKEKKVKYVNIEKDTLNRLTSHPGVVRLYYTFQDERSLYFVLDFAANGELLGVLKKMGTFDEECTRYYAAQLLDTIEYMHSRGVIHRDLKPENILLDKHMHTKITDFGTAKILVESRRSRASSGANGPGMPPGAMPEGVTEESDRANSFVGTAEYVSPELLTEKNACKASDLWAFGCIVYQLLAGRPPFKAANEYLTFQKIIHLDYRFPSGFPPAARDLVERCLVLDPRQRLTIEHIKNHDFFKGMKFGKNLWQQKAPQLKSYTPAPMKPIALGDDQRQQQKNAGDSRLDSAGNLVPDIQPSHSTRAIHLRENSPRAAKAVKRPQPRVITDVPPPSQLDIEWSPILAKDNERILKLGNLTVVAGAAKDGTAGHKHGDKEGKEESGGGGAFKRFFGGGGGLKRKMRMVMVTSNGRLLVANGPDEKKLKFEANLLGEGISWQKCLDSKGLAYWCLETSDKHFTFEDPKHSTSDISHTTAQAQEWLDALDRARDAAIGRSATGSASGFSSLLASPTTSKSPTLNFGAGGNANDSTSAFSASNFSIGGGPGAFTPGSYSASGSTNDLNSSRYAPGASGGNGLTPAGGGLVDQATNLGSNAVGSSSGNGRNHLQKPRDAPPKEDEPEDSKGGMSRGFKRFSKRSSKSGLAAVF